MKVLYSLRYAFSLMFLFSFPSLAGISIDVTRIIFNEGDSNNGKNISLTSSKNSHTPYLVKAQVLNDVTGDGGAPFIVTPSLFKIKPGESNKLAIIKNANDLPKDRESLFYFRAIFIPSGANQTLTPPPDVKGNLKVASATVIKLYYRPSGLAITQDQAMAELEFVSKNKKLHINNPSPYYITLKNIKINNKDVKLSDSVIDNVVAPYSTKTYPSLSDNGAVEWSSINDYGGTEVFHGSIQ